MPSPAAIRRGVVTSFKHRGVFLKLGVSNSAVLNKSRKGVNALLIFTQLTEMGMLSEEEPDGPVDKGQVYQVHSTPEADAKALASNRQKLEQEMQKARDWLSRELQA